MVKVLRLIKLEIEWQFPQVQILEAEYMYLMVQTQQVVEYMINGNGMVGILITGHITEAKEMGDFGVLK